MTLRRIHLTLFIVWVLLVPPTIIFWKNSIAWVAFMSIYACIGFHAVEWHNSRIEEKNDGEL